MRSVVTALFLVAVLLSVYVASAEEQKLSMSTDFTGVFLEAGGSFSASIRMRNEMDRAVVATFSIVKPEGWSASLFLSGYNVYQVFLGPGEERFIRLDVTSPADAKPGEYTISVSAEVDGKVIGSIPFKVSLKPRPTEEPVILTVPYPSLSGEPGSTVDFRFDINNKLDKEVVIGLDVIKAPNDWEVSFKPSTYENRIISSVTIGPKDSKYGLVMSVRIPSDAKPGEYKVTFAASAEGHTTTKDVIVRITGIKRFSVTTVDQLLNFEVQAGESKSITLVVINEGTATIPEITLSPTPPSGWRVAIEPQKIINLEPGSTATATLTVRPPDNALAGDYALRISALSKEAGNERLDLRATVTKQTFWGFIGVIVVVISVMALLVVFWRFGRP